MDTLGTLLVEKGETARGVDLLQKASSTAPEDATIRLNFAKGLVRAGRTSDARKELETLAKLGDRFPMHSEVAQMLKSL
jgi:cellulose synthase operon protein C